MFVPLQLLQIYLKCYTIERIVKSRKMETFTLDFIVNWLGECLVLLVILLILIYISDMLIFIIHLFVMVCSIKGVLEVP